MQELARVLDPGELDGAGGPRGRLTVDVLDEWLSAGATVEIVVPSRLACARCEGGGCDDCERSGGIRLSGDEAARTLRLALPAASGPRTGVRLARPLGENAGLEQLLIELRTAPEPSPWCRRLASDHAPALASRTRWVVAALTLLALVLAALFYLR